MNSQCSAIALSIAVLSGGLLLYSALSGSNHRLPPGPRRLPFVGNALQLPQTKPWLSFSEWTKKYGDLIHVDVFGRPLVIISSAKIANDLLEKRSIIYSNRPHFVMACDLVGYGETLVLQPHGENWREQRKIVAHDFNPGMSTQYYPLQEREARILVRNILEDVTSFISQIKLRIGIIIVRATYGYYIKDATDPFLVKPLQAMANFSNATTPGNFIVDFIPSLRYLPMWMPGSGFLRKAKEWRQVVWDTSWKPYQWSKNNMDNGVVLMPNLCGTALRDANGELSEVAESRLVWAASTVLGGGMDTNMSTALTFFLAMMLHPQVQEKAWQEIISVVGPNRLPAITDKESLPYVRSIVAEVFRWNPAVPMGIPHALSQDDTYKGYYLAKDTSVMANVWHILHDPEVYENPMEFIPERYQNMDSKMQKVVNLAFGFGRRSCPGIYFAEGTLFAIVLTTLASCKILPPLDAAGQPILPNVAYTTGTISFPESFRIRLEPRSTEVLDMLQDVTATPE